MPHRLCCRWIVAVLLAAPAGAVSAPEQATHLQASFRDGQTFLTWRESITSQARYRIYRLLRPFESAGDLRPENLLTTVGDFTSLNVMASINRMAVSKVRRGQEYAMRRRIHFVITDGDPPLDDDVALHVHTATANETAYYAVTAFSADGENTVLTDNTLRTGVSERVQPLSAVAQNGEIDYVHWTADGRAHNFRVHAPSGTGPFALIGVLHGALFQYNTRDPARYAKLDGEERERAVRVALDLPLIRGMIAGIDLPPQPRGAPMGWHTAADRVLWTMDWVASRHPVDRHRYSLRGESMGGMGSIAIALTHPNRIAAINAYVPAFGSEHETSDTLRAMLRVNPYELVKRSPAQSFPFLAYTAGRADHVVGWTDKIEFAHFAEKQHLGFIFYWDAREHAYANVETYRPVWGEPGGRPTVDLTRFSLRESYPAIANLTANDNLGTTNPLAAKPAERGPLDAPGMGDLVGTINGQVDWDHATLVDTPGRYEITLRLLAFSRLDSATADVTPRRLQRFSPQPSRVYRFQVAANGSILFAGQAAADGHGRLQVRDVPLTRAGTRLIIRE